MKKKRQIGVLFILIVGASIVWAWNFRDKRVVTADASPNLQDAPIFEVENPHIRMEQIGRTQGAEYKGSGRNPFSYALAPPKMPQAPKPSEIVGPKDQPPPPPPPPPTLPVKFYGFGTGFNGASRRAFFTDGEEVHIVGEGDVLLRRFRIIRIGNASVEFEEISTHRIGTAPLEEQAAPGSQQ